MEEIRVIYSQDIGDLVRKANNLEVRKENYIDIVKQGEIFIMLYEYKG